MHVAFDAQIEPVADLRKLAQADLAQLREAQAQVTQAEERVAVVRVDLRDEPGGCAAWIEELDHRDVIAPRLPVAYELFQEVGC